MFNLKDLYYKMLQDKTQVLKTDKHKYKEFKYSKKHVALLLCTNQTGNHKLFSLQKQIHKQIHFHRCLIVHMHL